ncbi:MAG: acyl-CoA dehydrogenase [Actinobacteria bacterium]|nr:MAG: acyl-CoA dehydrogenase [Actinomycetota bacterium]
MDLRYSESDERFRAEVRAWLAEALPALPPKPGPHDWDARRAYDTTWQRMLFDAGYAGINWPSEYGGRGASPTEHLIFLEETERAGAPYVGVNFVGLLHAGPTLIAEATEEQKAAHLPRILRGEEVWCQGFSEPGAGSDLASLKTRAVLDGDHYVVNGQKIWTSFAHVADFGELLVRTDTDAPKHKGITWLILPMDTPGIEVRPLRTIAGSSEFSEVFFTDVRIPVENRVGAENDGWRVAMVTFSFERGTAFVGELVRSMKLVEELAELARKLPRGSGSAWDDDGVRRELGLIAAQLDGLWHLTKRTITESERTGVPGIGGSIFKLYYSEVRHHLGDLAMRILGTAALATEDEPAVDHVRGWIHAMSISIAAGTTQIQRNILSERVLGMPKEPS